MVSRSITVRARDSGTPAASSPAATPKTAATKPAFRTPLRERRCLILAAPTYFNVEGRFRGKAVVVFPAPAPSNVGTFTRSGANVSFQPAPGVTEIAWRDSSASRSKPRSRRSTQMRW